MSRNHYVQVVRAFALLGGTASVTLSCASTVVPSFGDAAASETRTDVATRTDSGTCLTTCPVAVPPTGTPCSTGLSCTYPSMSGAETYCYCDQFGTDAAAGCAGTLRCSMAVPGPLPPPDLAA